MRRSPWTTMGCPKKGPANWRRIMVFRPQLGRGPNYDSVVPWDRNKICRRTDWLPTPRLHVLYQNFYCEGESSSFYWFAGQNTRKVFRVCVIGFMLFVQVGSSCVFLQAARKNHQSCCWCSFCVPFYAASTYSSLTCYVCTFTHVHAAGKRLAASCHEVSLECEQCPFERSRQCCDFTASIVAQMTLQF